MSARAAALAGTFGRAPRSAIARTIAHDENDCHTRSSLNRPRDYPDRSMATTRRPAAPTRERELVARDARAVRRARHAGRADRGDRPGGRDRARAHLPRTSPPRRSSTSSRSPTTSTSSTTRSRAARPALEPARAARALHRGLRRLLPALPRVPRLLALADAPPGARAARDDLRVGLVAARPGHGGAASARSPTSCAPARRAASFAVEDPDYTANVLWTQTLGTMHLARIRVGVRRVAGQPGLFPVEPEQVVASCVASALATVGAR